MGGRHSYPQNDCHRTKAAVSSRVNRSTSVGFCSAWLLTIFGNITATMGPTKKISARPIIPAARIARLRVVKKALHHHHVHTHHEDHCAAADGQQQKPLAKSRQSMRVIRKPFGRLQARELCRAECDDEGQHITRRHGDHPVDGSLFVDSD